MGSLPFGDAVFGNGFTWDYRFAGLDPDGESNTSHAQFRQLSTTQGRWLSPDPSNGSYDLANPQSFNRYSYVGNMPLGYRDPTGLFGEEIFTIIGQGTSICLNACAWAGPVGWAAAGVAGILELTHFLGVWGHPAFHGSFRL